MRIKIRIYNPYDLDIIALAETPNFSVPHAMRETLKYYAAGKRYLVEIPNLIDHLENEQYVKGFYVELDDSTDKQAIEFLKKIPEGLRNSFMKNIFRASFEVCPLSLYMGDGGAEYVGKMVSNPRYGRHPVQREIVDPVYLAEGEIGVQLSDTTSVDFSKMPKGEKPKPKQQKPKKEKKPSGAVSNKDKLRELTQNAYSHASDEAKKQEQIRKKALERKEHVVDDDASDELDALLDSIM